ncbi:MAG: JDVT-CTERM system glutamic-type intramembrane protease [Burkholderiales bacterium]
MLAVVQTAVQASSGLPPPWLLLLVIAPLLEETVFRAGLHEALLRRWGHSAGSVLVINLAVGLAFAFAHLVVRGGGLAALTLLPALVIGFIYQRQRRLAPCIVMHALFNGVWLTLSS